MAILEGVTTNVTTVHGTALTEYEDEEQLDRITLPPFQANRYIEAMSGSNFEIECSLGGRLTPQEVLGVEALGIDVYVDGERMQTMILRDHHKAVARGRSSYDKLGNGTRQPYMFSDIQTEEESRPLQLQQHKEMISKLGVITLKIYRISRLTATVRSAESRHSAFGTTGPIPEKALKGQTLTHQVQLGAAVNIGPTNFFDCTYIDHKDSPYLTFQYKYRSRAALQSLLIIPRDTTPLPPEERAIEELSREEMAEQLRRFREQAGSRQGDGGVKKEEKPRLKREHDPEFEEILASARPLKTQRMNEDEEIECIDLT